MARIVAIEKGALGAVKAVAEDGSLFYFRPSYLGAVPGLPPFEVPDEALALAVDATLAESRALALLARAEQFRAGLERKLAARGHPRRAVGAALDRLEADGYLSDYRYAEAWIRQRVRSRAEGPRSLAAALASRGLDARAVKRALEAAFGGEDRYEERLEIIVRALRRLIEKGEDTRAARSSLVELGWRRGDIDDALDRIEP